MNRRVECTKCAKVVCGTEHSLGGPSNCPMKTKPEVIRRAVGEYGKPEIKEFARQATIQEFECYMSLPEGMTPRNPRVEEVAQFAKKMGYKKLGIAFCGGLREEAKVLTKILGNRGFDVVSVCCKVGAVPKETIGIVNERDMSMCNPITQAELLNDAGVEFNIMVGLCVGHDSLFIKYAHAPITVLVAKDRVFGHNPAAALYMSGSYYRKLLRKEATES